VQRQHCARRCKLTRPAICFDDRGLHDLLIDEVAANECGADCHQPGDQRLPVFRERIK
jgi:hypothetical protein